MSARIQTHRALILLVVELLALTLLTACGEGPADVDPPSLIPYAARGDYAVGHRAFDAEGLDIAAWYPADGDAYGPIEYPVVLQFPGFPPDPLAILGHGLPDAEPAAGRFPLVVLSHGFALNPAWYHDLAEHLASHGFVVLAPEHRESDWAADIIDATVGRPAEVSATIDFAIGGPLSAHVDPDHIAVVGHSYGGYTALAAAGARFDVDGLAERCADVEDEFMAAYFCAPFLDGEDALAAALGLDAAPDGLWPSLGDARVDAIVALAGDAYLFGDRGLAAVDVPALFIGGTADSGTPWDWGAGLGFAHVGSEERALVALEGAEHMVGVAPCSDLLFMAAFPEEMQAYFCEDPAWEKRAALDTVNHFTTVFLLRHLRDRATPAIDPAVYAAEPALSLYARRASPDVPGPIDR